MRLAALDHGRVVDRHVALEDLRAGRRRDPLRPDHVLHRDRSRPPRTRRRRAGSNAAPDRARRSPRGRRRRARRSRPPCRERGARLPRPSVAACRSFAAGRDLEVIPSRSGAFASASSTERHGRGSSAAQTFTTSSGCEVGGTSERSSSDTFETAARMSFSCAPRRSSSSSRSSRRARCATWRSCSRSIAIRFENPSRNGRGPCRGLFTQ